MTKSRHILAPRRRWAQPEVDQLRARYPHEPTQAIADALGRELRTVYVKARHLGLAKTDAYMASPAACRLRRGDNVGAAHRFSKGHVPANKGLRRPGWSAGRMAETQFKKGRPAHESRNYLPIGSVRVNADGYLDRKISDTGLPQRRWRCVHRIVWEDANGPVPEGFVVCFREGRKGQNETSPASDAQRAQILSPRAASAEAQR